MHEAISSFAVKLDAAPSTVSFCLGINCPKYSLIQLEHCSNKSSESKRD